MTEQVVELGPAVTQVQDAAANGDLPVPEAVRETYEKAEDDEQYAALASSLPRAARVISAVGAAVDDAATDRDPVSALGAAVLGVQKRSRCSRPASSTRQRPPPRPPRGVPTSPWSSDSPGPCWSRSASSVG